MDRALAYTRTLVAQLSPPILNEFGLPDGAEMAGGPDAAGAHREARSGE